MSFKFFLMYEVVRLVVCQRFYKKNFKIIPRKCKRPFFEKRNCDFLNYRDMNFFFFFFRESFNLWHPLLMIALYQQTKTPISFWCRRRLNPRSLIQPSETLPVETLVTLFMDFIIKL